MKSGTNSWLNAIYVCAIGLALMVPGSPAQAQSANAPRNPGWKFRTQKEQVA